MTFTNVANIIEHIRGNYPHLRYVGEDYTVADLIADLERKLAEDAAKERRLEILALWSRR